MNTLQAEKLREYIDVQIEYMLAKQEEGADRYRSSTLREEEIADHAWAAFLSALEERADD